MCFYFCMFCFCILTALSFLKTTVQIKFIHIMKRKKREQEKKSRRKRRSSCLSLV